MGPEGAFLVGVAVGFVAALISIFSTAPVRKRRK